MKHRRINLQKVALEVLDAINGGKRTFSEIKQETGRTADRVSEALALLVLRAKRVRAVKTNTGHLYYPAERPARKPESMQARNDTPALSFSTLPALMPERVTGRVSEARK